MSVIDKIQINSTTYDVAAGAGNVAYSDAATYPDGSAGKEISQLKSEIAEFTEGTYNLFDYEHFNNNWILSDGSVRTGIDYAGTDYIPCDPGDVYTLSFSKITNGKQIVWWTENKEYISRESNQTGDLAISSTAPNNAAYVTASVYIGNSVTVTSSVLSDYAVLLVKGTSLIYIPPVTAVDSVVRSCVPSTQSGITIVKQGWSGATQKPQSYYANCKTVPLVAGDIITPKTGFDCAIADVNGSTLVAWFSTAYTVTSAYAGARQLLIRRTGAVEELNLIKFGNKLTDYITESYQSKNPEYVATEIINPTLNTLLSAVYNWVVPLINVEDKSKWHNKKAAFVGDSITYGVNTTAGNIYYQLLNDKIGFSSVYADGITGSCYSVASNYGSTNTPISQRYQNIPSDCDLVVLFAGTNDWGHNTPIGTLADTTDVSLYGALNVTISGILEANPDVRLVIFTPLHRWGFGDYQEDTGNNGQGQPLKAYVDAIKASAEMFGVPVIDLFSIACLNPRISAIKTAYVTDGLHPNAAGHNLLADRIAPLLETL